MKRKGLVLLLKVLHLSCSPPRSLAPSYRKEWTKDQPQEKAVVLLETEQEDQTLQMT